MPKRSLFKSPEAEAEMLELYYRQLERLNIEYESKIVDTRFGFTHVLVTGPKEAPPLVLLHGWHSHAAYELGLFTELNKHFRIYSPDINGQSIKSNQFRIPSEDNSYGVWLIEVLDALNLDTVPVVSLTFACGILLKAGIIDSKRISSAVLAFPFCIVNFPVFRLLEKLVIPLFLYSNFPTRKRIIKACTPMMAGINEGFMEMIGAMYRLLNMNNKPHKLFTKEQLKDFKSPTMAVLATEDQYVPIEKVIPRLKEIIPNLVKLECIDGPMVSSKQVQDDTAKKILEFIRRNC